jgi:hypothetical protein
MGAASGPYVIPRNTPAAISAVTMRAGLRVSTSAKRPSATAVSPTEPARRTRARPCRSESVEAQGIATSQASAPISTEVRSRLRPSPSTVVP